MFWIELPDQVDEMAPDGSEVRFLMRGDLGGMAQFRLAPGGVSVAKQHRSVEELWYFLGGKGEMCVDDDVFAVHAGVSVRIPPGARFQFRSLDDEPLDAIGVTMPPWPGDDEAVDAAPMW
jgi:mannose-6-phosphate isomerase-like protein (cupin superfamily)